MLQPDRECGQFRDEAKIVAIADFELNDSQSDAVASCISATKCPDKSSLLLAWGPPGTGKTKTFSLILHMLLLLAFQQLNILKNLVCI